MKICISYDRNPVCSLPSFPKKCRVRAAPTIHPPYDIPLFEGKSQKEGLGGAYSHPSRTNRGERSRDTGFEISVNCGASTGQTIMPAHIHLIPEQDGDTLNLIGGVREVIPGKKG